MLRCDAKLVNGTQLPAVPCALDGGAGRVGPNLAAIGALAGQSWERLVALFASLALSAIRHRYRLA